MSRDLESENVVGLHLDTDGTVLVIGDTFSEDFPTTPSSLQPDFAGGNNDLFVSRLSANGSALAWSTFYGGTSFELANDSALLPSGDVLLSASPNASTPSATQGAFDTTFDPGDKLVARLSADGTAVVFQTYFDSGNIHLAVGPDESIYMSGSAGDTFPATPGAFKESKPPGSHSDGFVARMDAMGTTLHWATYLGGDTLTETVPGIAVDAAGAVYVAGLTDSSDFPVTPGAFATSTTAPDSGFVTKLLPSGTGLVWSTYIGGCYTGTSLMFDIVVDRAGNAIAVGSSNEPNFPTTPDAFQSTFMGGGGAADAHLTKFDAFGETLVYSTYFGGSGSDYLPHVALDAAHDPCMALRTSSNNLPVTPGVYDPSFGGSTDIAVTRFDLDLAPWEVLGGALAGSLHTPNLSGAGALTPGSAARLSVRGAAPLSSASLIAGLTTLYAPLKGGTLVPALHVVVPLFTSGQGTLDIPFNWLNVPAGIDLWVQVWIKDVGSPTGFSATNALKMTSQ
jgi:hypothetical protein